MVVAVPRGVVKRPAYEFSRKATIRGIETCLMVLSLIMSWLLSGLFVSPVWSLVALFNYLWMASLFFRISPRVTVLELPQLITRASSVVALIFIEYGAPIPELATVGRPGTLACAYVFYMAILFAVTTSCFVFLVGPEDRAKPHPLTPVYDRFATPIALGLLGIVGLTTLWLVFRGLVSGFPLLSGTDRFLYRRMVADPVLSSVLAFKYVLLFGLGMVSFRLPTTAIFKTAANLLALVSIVVYFLFADKFFTQLIGISGFFAPYLYYQHDKVRKYALTFMVAGTIAIGMVFSVTWYIYSKGGTESSAATWERLSGRMVGQGELWFVQGQVGAPLLTWDKSFVQRNYNALFVKDADLYAIKQSLGPNYFSNLYAPDNIRASMDRNAGTVTFTAALEALGLMAFGWVGLGIFQVILGILMCFSTVYLAYAIRTRSVISGLMASLAWISYRYFLAQGTPWVMVGIHSGKWLVLMGLIELALYLLGRSQHSSSPLAIQRYGSASARPIR